MPKKTGFRDFCPLPALNESGIRHTIPTQKEVAERMEQNLPARPARERDVSLDIMKAICIILMVYAHTLPFCRDFLHVIVIPTFLMVSGYCWHAKIRNWREFGRFFLKRLKALYIPFVLYNGSYALLGGLFLRLGFYTDDPALFDIARNWPISQHLYGLHGFGDCVRKFLKILVMQDTTQLGTATWFLIMLVAISFTHGLQELLSSRLNISEKLWLPIGELVLMAALSQFYVAHQRDQTYLKCFFCCYYSFLIGLFFQRIRWRYFYSWWMGLLGAGGALLVSLFYRYELSAAIISDVPIYLFSCTCAWVMMKSLSQGITHIRWLLAGLNWIGRHTIPIMCLHVLIFKLPALLYIRLHDLPRVYLAAWHTILDTSQLWKLVFTGVGVGGSLLIAWLWEQLHASVMKMRQA